jgi:hypothetical protein
MNKKLKFKGIPFDSIIKIEVSGGFTARLQELAVYHLSQKTPEEVNEIIEKIKTKEPENEYEYHLLTLLVLIHEIESESKKQGILKDMEVEVDEKGKFQKPSES